MNHQSVPAFFTKLGIKSSNGNLSQAESTFYDFLRSILMLRIMLGHLAAISFPPLATLMTDPGMNWLPLIGRISTRIGLGASILFIFMSGFFVGGSLLKRYLATGSLISFSEFFKARTVRIIPITWAALFFALAIDSIALSHESQKIFYSNIMGLNIEETLNFTNFMGSALLSRPLFSEAFGTTGPLWTLCIIFQATILFYILLSAIRHSVIHLILLLIGIIGFTFYLGYEWILGIVVFICAATLRASNLKTRHPLPWLGCFLVIFIGTSIMPFSVAASLSLLLGVLLLVCARGLKDFSEWPIVATLKRPAHILASASFAIYATHLTTGSFIVSLLYGVFDRGNPIVQGISWMVGVLVALIIGWAFWRMDASLQLRLRKNQPIEIPAAKMNRSR